MDRMDVVPTSQVGTGEFRVFDGRLPNLVRVFAQRLFNP